MKTERLKELYVKYSLTKDDVFKHQHYVIITRSGIDKIQAKEKINIDYENEKMGFWACCDRMTLTTRSRSLRFWACHSGMMLTHDNE